MALCCNTSRGCTTTQQDMNASTVSSWVFRLKLNCSVLVAFAHTQRFANPATSQRPCPCPSCALILLSVVTSKRAQGRSSASSLSVHRQPAFPTDQQPASPLQDPCTPAAIRKTSNQLHQPPTATDLMSSPVFRGMVTLPALCPVLSLPLHLGLHALTPCNFIAQQGAGSQPCLPLPLPPAAAAPAFARSPSTSSSAPKQQPALPCLAPPQ